MGMVTIASRPVLFTRFFSEDDTARAVATVRELQPELVLCIDTPPTPGLVSFFETVTGEGVPVKLADHHGVANPKTEREAAIATNGARLLEMAAPGSCLTTRSIAPGCAQLVHTGEFNEDGILVIADADRDGLLGAMKALGISYPGMEEDAAILDGPPGLMTRENGVSEVGMLLVVGVATLPPFNPARPEALEQATDTLFAQFVAAVEGDEEAMESLLRRIEDYEEQCGIARTLAESSTEVLPGVYLADVRGAPRYNFGEFSRVAEALPGCRTTVVVKSDGPIAAIHGCQYSLAVPKQHQQEINLHELLPEGMESSPQTGIISNTSFLLHCSEEVWTTAVKPGLEALLAE